MLAGLCLLVAAGCSGPLKVNYTAKEKAAAVATPVVVLVTEFKDARGPEALKNPRDIGRIDATVADISGTRLVLADPPASIVTDAFAKELSSLGYDVKRDGAETDADFVLKGEVREFRLDILGRDRIKIEVWGEITEKETGRAVWSGVESEETDRYAGVVGNSKATIARYINATLAKVAGKAVSAASPKLANTRASYRPKALEEARPMEPERAGEKAVAEGTGRFVIKTEPQRARVYIGGVYYGLTPLSLDLEPGVYEVEIKHRGYRDVSEKVSVRKSDFTELEVGLEGE